MVGTGEIKYTGRTKTITAAFQFDIGLSKDRGKKTLIKNNLVLQVGGLMQQATTTTPPRSSEKKTAKKPIGKTLDGCITNKFG